MPPDPAVQERSADDPELARLLDLAYAELVQRYGAEGRSAVHPRARYLVAVSGGRCLGCGALQPAGRRTGELKRMYVHPSGHCYAKLLVPA